MAALSGSPCLMESRRNRRGIRSARPDWARLCTKRRLAYSHLQETTSHSRRNRGHDPRALQDDGERCVSLKELCSVAPLQCLLDYTDLYELSWAAQNGKQQQYWALRPIHDSGHAC